MEPWGTPRDVVKVLEEVPLNNSIVFCQSNSS